MPYKLMVARKPGSSAVYLPEAESEKPEDFWFRVEKLDEAKIRWFIRKPDGHQDFRYICAAHKELLGKDIKVGNLKINEEKKNGV